MRTARAVIVLALVSMFAAAACGQIIVAINQFYDAPDFDVTDGVIDADNVAPGNQITLRAAIMHANFTGGNWKFLLGSGVYTLSVPGAGENAAFAGDLDISNLTLEIAGVPLPATRIDAATMGDRAFHVLNSSRVTFRDVEIVNGASVGGGAMRQEAGTRVSMIGVRIDGCSATGAAGANGGGILSFGDLALTGCAVSNGLADGSGGGVHFEGPSLSVLGSQFVANLAGGRGGGINAPNAASGVSLAFSDVVGNRSGLGIGGGSGGGISARATMTLDTCVVDSNSTNAGASGGGIETRGAITLINSAVRSNTASLGGGLQVAGLATALLVDSAIHHNLAEIGGGAYNAGTLEIRHSTIHDNQAVIPPGIAGGGGIYSFATLYLVNSTISGNQAVTSHGGGLYNASSGYAEISSCTFHNNVAPAGGVSIYNGDIGFNPKVIVRNTILSNFPVLSPNYFDPSGIGIASDGHNYDTEGTFFPLAPTDLSPINGASPNPYLGPLQFNGGPTMTHRVFFKSDAIGAANPGGAFDHTGNILLQDQRYEIRPNVSVADIGAYEARCDADLYPSPAGDGLVEDMDFVEFANAYNILLTGAADFDGDDDTDDDDFVVFATAYNLLFCE